MYPEHLITRKHFLSFEIPKYVSASSEAFFFGGGGGGEMNTS